MAVGEGGFSIKPMGFDKNEVNEYISNIRKRMNEMEAEKKVNDEKTKAAVKTAEEAENRIKTAEQQGAEKIAELELQVKTERRNAESLTIQIDELKRKLKQKSAAPAAGGAGTAVAEKQAADIIAKANKTARDIVEKAKQSAQQLMANAQSAADSAVSAQNNNSINEFMDVLKNYLGTVNDGFNAVNRKAAEILGAPAPAPVSMPDLSAVTAPRAEVPAPAPSAAEEPELSLSGSLFDNMDDASDDSSMDPGGFSLDDIAMINPDAPKAEPVDSFDLSNVGAPAAHETDTAKAPSDTDFMADLLAQTVPSSALGNDVDADVLAAVKAQEEKFAVQPADANKELDFNMDMDEPAPAAASAPDDDPMAALLAQAQAAFGGGASMELSEPESASAPEPEASSANPWEDLQKQLEAMEQSGNLGGAEPSAAEPAKNIAEDPKTPSADDSAIWNFGGGDSDSGDDDMMSSDLFGSF